LFFFFACKREEKKQPHVVNAHLAEVSL